MSHFVKNSILGKSNLVFEIQQSIASEGAFIYGKYDQFRPTQYSGLIEAMEMFCDDIALKKDSVIKEYKSLISNAVGDEGKLLANLIGNLRGVIGNQPEVGDKFGREATNRLNYVFTSFIKAVASVSKPLVLVIDDLQWIDSASIELLKVLIKNKPKNLMFVGIHRDIDEILGAGHPQQGEFMNFVREINANATNITVHNLDFDSVNSLISEVLHIPSTEAHQLTAYVNSKTQGSPLFVKELLRTLFESDKITFNYKQNKWQWDKSIYDAEGVAENVFDHLRQKIQSLSLSTQETLKVCYMLRKIFFLVFIA